MSDDEKLKIEREKLALEREKLEFEKEKLKQEKARAAAKERARVARVALEIYAAELRYAASRRTIVDDVSDFFDW